MASAKEGRRVLLPHNAMNTNRRPRAWLWSLPLVALACGSDSQGSVDPDAGVDAGDVDLSEELFRPDHVLEVRIEMAPADWAVLREQPDVLGMPKITCGEQPTDKPYDYFPGDITIDGVTTANVGVRKKGGFGSISSARPGLKIKPNEYTKGQRIFGLKRLTLNNNHQDESQISQCLGYALFRDAGVAASRCSFAHVVVNGEDLGIYSNVESIKKDFLGRHFSDDSGSLYESGGDFTAGGTDGFQPKVDKDNPECSDLDRVVDALQTSDANFPEAIDTVVDTDAFMSFWAMEVIADHWDGYANNTNNFFFYHDPSSDKFHFIPWGIDALFSGKLRSTRPDSVFACGSLPWRLYDVQATRDQYLARLRQLLDTVWDEPVILAEIDRMEALIEPYADATQSDSLAGEIEGVRDFVRGRRAALLLELDAGTPVWPYPAGEESCRIKIGTVTATFDTTWDSLDDFSAGSGEMNGTVGGTPLSPSTVNAGAGVDDDRNVLRIIATLGDGTLAVVYVIVNDAANLVPGTQSIDLINIAAFMTFYDPETETSFGGGLLLGGALTFTSLGTTPGAAVVGSLTSDVLEL